MHRGNEIGIQHGKEKDVKVKRKEYRIKTKNEGETGGGKEGRRLVKARLRGEEIIWKAQRLTECAKKEISAMNTELSPFLVPERFPSFAHQSIHRSKGLLTPLTVCFCSFDVLTQPPDHSCH